MTFHCKSIPNPTEKGWISTANLVVAKISRVIGRAKRAKRKDSHIAINSDFRPSSETLDIKSWYQKKRFGYEHACLSDSDSEYTLTEDSAYSGSAFSECQAEAAKDGIVKYEIDCVPALRYSKPKESRDKKKPESQLPTSSKSKSGSKRNCEKVLGRFFTWPCLVPPVAIYNVPIGFNGDQMNVYWVRF